MIHIGFGEENKHYTVTQNSSLWELTGFCPIR